MSKLLLLFFVRDFAARHPISTQSNVIIDNMTPGACKSDLFREETSRLQKLAMGTAMAIIARTTEVGGRTLTHSIDPDLGVEAHGRFLMDCKVFP